MKRADEKARKDAERQRIAQEKEEERLRRTQVKEEKREADQSKRFWGGVAKSVFVPIARQIIGSLFKRR